VIQIKDYLINSYVERVTSKDIDNFAVKQGISLTKEENEIIMNYIKNHWRTFYYGNPKELLSELKEKLNSLTYAKLEQLYVQAKEYISYKNP